MYLADGWFDTLCSEITHLRRWINTCWSPFTLRQLLVTTTHQSWSGEARNLQRRGPEITVKVKMQPQETRGGSGVSPPRKFSSFTWWNDEFWCVFWIQFSFSLTFPWLCHILSIFPDFPWPPKFPDLFQFSLTCRNPGEVPGVTIVL